MIDIVIVGAGIVGAFAAHIASRADPKCRIVLVDRALALCGATRRSAGLDFEYGATEFRRALVRESRIAYETLQAWDQSLPIRTVPLVCIASRRTYSIECERFVGRRPHPASPDEVEDLRRRYPELQLHHDDLVLSGLRCSAGDAAGVGARLLDDLRERDNVLLWEGAEVVRFEAQNSRCDLTLADGRAIRALRAVFALGPWAVSGVLGSASSAAGIRTKRVVALHLDRRPAADDPVVFFLDEDAFLLPLPRERLTLFSFTRWLWDVNPDLMSPTVDVADRDSGLSVLAGRAPGLAAVCVGGRAFCDAYGPNFETVVSAHPQTARAAFVGAASGSGYRLAPALAATALRACGAIDNTTTEKRRYDASS